MKKTKTKVSVVNNVGIRRTADVHIGDDGPFPSGDILDANATLQLVGGALINPGVDPGLTGKYNIVVCTLEEYDNLEIKDMNTLYFTWVDESVQIVA